MRIRINLCIGVAVAIIAFVLGWHSGTPFFEGLNKALSDTAWETAFPFMESALGSFIAISMFAAICTMAVLVWLAYKWWCERYKPESVQEVDLGHSPLWIGMIILGLLSSSYICGMVATVLPTTITALIATFATLPTILQFIDYLAPGNDRHGARRPGR